MLRRKGELSQSNLMFSAMEQKLQDFAFLAQWKCDLSDLQIWVSKQFSILAPPIDSEKARTVWAKVVKFEVIISFSVYIFFTQEGTLSKMHLVDKAVQLWT